MGPRTPSHLPVSGVPKQVDPYKFCKRLKTKDKSRHLTTVSLRAGLAQDGVNLFPP